MSSDWMDAVGAVGTIVRRSTIVAVTWVQLVTVQALIKLVPAPLHGRAYRRGHA